LRFFTLLAIPISAAVFTGNAAFGAAPHSSPEIKREIERLEKAADALTTLHRQLSINEKQMAELHQRSLKNLQGNLLKVYIKGGMDIWNKASAPVGSAAELVSEALLNLYLEPLIYIPEKDQVALLSLSRQAAQKNRKLKSLYEAIGEVMAADSVRFDDDLPPIRYTASWWKAPDSEKDDSIELVTRKTNIIVNLSDKVYQATIREKARVRRERRTLLQHVKTLEAELGQKIEEEKIEEETKAFHKRIKERQQSEMTIPSTNDRGESLSNHVPRRPAAEMPPGSREAQRKARQKREAAYKRRAEAIKEMKAKESRATVYIPSDIPRHYVVGDRVIFSALIDPPEVRGKMEWRLDDKRIGRGKNVTHTFTESGKFDLSVTLNIRFKFQDKYLDQIYVEEAAEKSDSGPPVYPAALEGKKIPAMNLPCCKYWILHKNNRVYVTGHYYTPSGRKIDYTSQAIKNYNPQSPAAGMFALLSGNGYHVYQTYGGKTPQVRYIVAKMTSSGVSVTHRLDLIRFGIDVAPDMARATLTYQTELNGPERKILLK